MTKPYGRRGFTLMEVVVVVGIIATLVGIMIPFVYKVWESNERDLTRQRMADLKKAMVGDSRMVQNGLRTHFGYVGDIGQLPQSLAGLVTDPGVFNWQGPYLPAGFDPAAYNKDAWGNALLYSPAKDGADRYASASLTSKGPNGQAGDSDDISEPEFQISDAEVTPVAAIQGNLQLVLQTPPESNKLFYIGVLAAYRDGTGQQATIICCDHTQKQIPGTPGNTVVMYTRDFSCTPPVMLPAGILHLSPRVYSANTCSSGSMFSGSGLGITAHAAHATIFANLQLLSVVLP